MKKYNFILCLLILVTSSNFSFGQNNKLDIGDLLQKNIGDWIVTEEPERYGGDDLYFLINGGADLFLEYGFVEVIAAKYINGDNFINVEIYEMEDPAAAFGIYTIKKYAEGEQVNIGNTGSILGSFLIFWKDKYAVIINGSDTDVSVVPGIKNIAKLIDDKIEVTETTLEIAKLIPADSLIVSSVKYFEGMLGLNSVYIFGYKNIFGFKQCMFAEYDDHKLFIMGYDTIGEAASGLDNALNSLKENNKFSGFTDLNEGCALTDRRDKHLTIQRVDKYIVMTISENEFDPAAQIKSIKEKL